MGYLTPQTIPLFCACLVNPTDLTRYRARLALVRERAASALGRETIEQIARCYRCQDRAARAGCPATGEGTGCWRDWVDPGQMETLSYAVESTWIGRSRRSSTTGRTGCSGGRRMAIR